MTVVLGEMQNYTIYPAVFDTLTVNHMIGLEFSSNIQKLIAMAGGSVDPSFIAEVVQENEIQLTSGDIATILATVSPTNGKLVTTTGEIQYQQCEDGGVHSSNAEHVTLNSTRGMLIPRSISSSQDAQDAAAMVFSYFPLRVGANAPFVVNIDQNLTGLPAVNAVYKQGPVVYENTLLKDIQDASTDFGITYEQWRGSGDVSASKGSITKREPKMEFSGRNLALLNAIGTGLKGMTNGITQYYRRIGWGDATNNHVAVSFSAGTYEVTSVSGQGTNKVDKKITVTGAGTISVSLATSIPT